MADGLLPGDHRAAAIATIGTWLMDDLGALPLGTDVLWAYAGDATDGWRLGFEAVDRQVVVDLVVTSDFPYAKPQLFWVNAPAFPSIPHIEPNGRICILNAAATIDPLEPVKVASTLLADAEDVIATGLRGDNHDDFRTEFRSYWNEVAKGRDVISIVDPCEASRTVWGWVGKDIIVIAEERRSLRHWLRNALGKNAADNSIIPVPLLWLRQPLAPQEYPRCETELAAIAATIDPGAVQIYEAAISDEVEANLVLLGAPLPDGGACFGAVTLARRSTRFPRADRRVKGFRSNVPQSLLRLARRQDAVTLSPVARADPWWVHGRDAQDDLEELLGASITMIGCGSLGSPIARLLAQAGVGEINLIDPERLTFANVGRHVLGAGAVGRSKSLALRDHLAQAFPHLTVNGRHDTWQKVARDEPDLLARSDLIICSIGDWQAESALNAFQLAMPDRRQILYSWAEPHALGGHAVLIDRNTGCLACGLSPFGGSLFKIATFEESTLRREPACGAFFQPYGAGDIMKIAILASRLATDALHGQAVAGEHRLIAAGAEEVAANGGAFTQDWIALSAGPAGQGNLMTRRWDKRPDCRFCSGSGS